MAETTSRKAPGVRRNGKLQACEPCRKRKLVCDHATPCGRCVKRNTVAQCYYHPAPMTRQTTRSDAAPKSSNVVLSPAGSPIAPASGSPRIPGQLDPFSELSTTTTSRPNHDLSEHGDIGFLGASSSSVVVDEVLVSLGISSPPKAIERSNQTISEYDIRRGAEVLTLLKEFISDQTFMDRRAESSDSHLLPQPVLRAWIRSTHMLFAGSPQPHDMNALSALVWRNTQKSLKVGASMSAQDWALQSSGNNLRWEVVGLLISTDGMIAGTLPGWDPAFTKNKNGICDRYAMLRIVLSMVDICLGFCRQCDELNELTVVLICDSTTLHERVGGDFSRIPWTKFGEACDSVVHLGYHQDRTNNAQLPFFITEFRVRIFFSVWVLDKFLAMFLGRPPRLSHRHCAVVQPYDLSDEQWCLPEPMLSRVLADLVDGSTVSGEMHRITWRRMSYGLGLMREDVLEVILAPPTADLEPLIQKARQRIEYTRQSWPDFAKIDPEELLDNLHSIHTRQIPGRNRTWRPLDVHYAVMIQGAFRHTTFNLERAIFNRQKSNSSSLLQSAQDSLRLALKIIRAKDYLKDFQIDMMDTLAYLAMPPAGMLAIELIKREQTMGTDENFSCSNIVQQLSVLVHALDSVDPQEGNHRICAMGSNAIRQVLDRVIRKPSQPVTGPLETTDFLHDFQFGLPLNATGDSDFVEWLGHMDFTGSAWLDNT